MRAFTWWIAALLAFLPANLLTASADTTNKYLPARVDNVTRECLTHLTEDGCKLQCCLSGCNAYQHETDENGGRHGKCFCEVKWPQNWMCEQVEMCRHDYFFTQTACSINPEAGVYHLFLKSHCKEGSSVKLCPES